MSPAGAPGRGRGLLAAQLLGDLLGGGHRPGERVQLGVLRGRRLVILDELCGHLLRLLCQNVLLLLPREPSKRRAGGRRRRLAGLQALPAELGPHGWAGPTEDLRQVVGLWRRLRLADQRLPIWLNLSERLLLGFGFLLLSVLVQCGSAMFAMLIPVAVSGLVLVPGTVGPLMAEGMFLFAVGVFVFTVSPAVLVPLLLSALLVFVLLLPVLLLLVLILLAVRRSLLFQDSGSFRSLAGLFPLLHLFLLLVFGLLVVLLMFAFLSGRV